MKPIRRTLSAFLILTLLTASLAACGGSTSESELPAEEPQETAAETEEEEEEKAVDPKTDDVHTILNSFPKNNYEGYNFTILDRSLQLYGAWVTQDVYAEGETGEALNDAVYRRNVLMEDYFNIKIVEAPAEGAAPGATAALAVQAGEDAYDLMTDSLNEIFTRTSDNIFLNLNAVPGLRLDQPWWDQPMQKGFTILGRSYLMTGDISMMDNYGTWCIIFNKPFVKDFSLADPYQLVRDGKWTLDAMYDMMETVSNDTNGDGKMDVNDRWGLLTEVYNVYVLWTGCNNQIATLNADGLPEVTLISERASDAYDKILNMMYNKNLCGVVGQPGMPTYEAARDSFYAGNTLFKHNPMSNVTNYRNCETDYGVLPSPKFDEAQENYQNSFSSMNMTAYAIPSTASDPERTGILTEAMAELSVQTVTPAYYDVTLMGKSIRDNESEEMIELILNTRCYDIGLIFQWGNFISDNVSLNKIGTYISQCEKQLASIEASLEKYVERLQSIE